MRDTKTLCLVLMAAGSSTRFSSALPPHKRIKKQWLRIHSTPLWQKVLEDLKKLYAFDEIFIGAEPQEVEYMQRFCEGRERVRAGGDTRAESLRNILSEVRSDYVFVTDVARCIIDVAVCEELLEDFGNHDCSVPYLPCVDTILQGDTPLERQAIKLIQTPQISHAQKLKEALSKQDYTDESTAMLDNGFSVRFLQGSPKMQKLTTLQDLKLLSHLSAPESTPFIGSGLDIHAFEEGKPMMLGGLRLPEGYGFKAHSDGDVLLHALIDALLGAVGAGDIGEWFPDNDPAFKGADSKALLERVRGFITSIGYEIHNIDITLLAQIPKISPHKEALRQSLSTLLHLPLSRINIKATTAEKMGFVGRSEGICVLANASLKFINWKELI